MYFISVYIMSVRFEGVNLNPRAARQGLKKSRIGSRRGAGLLIWNPIPARAPTHINKISWGVGDRLIPAHPLEVTSRMSLWSEFPVGSTCPESSRSMHWKVWSSGHILRGIKLQIVWAFA